MPGYYRATYTSVVTTAFFETVSRRSQPRCPPTEEEIETAVRMLIRVVFGHKEEKDLPSVTQQNWMTLY